MPHGVTSKFVAYVLEYGFHVSYLNPKSASVAFGPAVVSLQEGKGGCKEFAPKFSETLRRGRVGIIVFSICLCSLVVYNNTP